MKDNNIVDLIKSKHILYLNHDLIQSLGVFDFSSNTKLIEEAYRAHWNGDARLCNSDYLTYQGRSNYDRIITLLGYLGGKTNVSGLKQICSSTLNASLGLPRASGLIILNDLTTQRPFCILEASLISAARTTAVTALSIEYLSPSNIQKIAIIGCGFMAKTHLQMWNQLYSEKQKKIYIFDTKQSAMKDIVKFGENLQLELILMESAEEAIRDADLIIPITTEEKPYINADWIKRGSLYSAVSLLDPMLNVFLNSDYIIVDDEELCKHEGRPLQILDKQGQLKNKTLYSLGQIICNNIEIRKTETEKVIFNPMGTVITDLVIAKYIFDKAIEEKVGLQLPL